MTNIDFATFKDLFLLSATLVFVTSGISFVGSEKEEQVGGVGAPKVPSATALKIVFTRK